VIWLWEAASKAIFLHSDGYLSVHGKGTVLAAAKAPVLLDFGPGFMCKGGFESRVAHVLATKLVKDNLRIKFRWLNYDDLLEELSGCPPKLFSYTGSSRTSTT
jgi:hypothetical protein